MNASVAFYTLGCKLNFTETSAIGEQLVKAGMETVEFTKGADIYVINTCSVTDHADRKCKRVVKEALKHNTDAFVVVVGCYAQLKPKEIAEIPGVDMVLGAAEKFNLVHHLADLSKRPKATVHNASIKETRDFVPAFSKDERTRTFLKVQDGCDYFCSFCTIPLARGKSRSASIEETIISAEEAAKYANEIILTGVNIGEYERSSGERLEDLVSELAKVDGLERLRLGSVEPNTLSESLVKTLSEIGIYQDHFHIPMQSGSDSILKSMRRKYDVDFYKKTVKMVQEYFPNASFGADVIVGYPGESEEDFKKTFDLLSELPINHFHVFPYSKRKNTTAAKMDNHVQAEIKKARVKTLINLGEQKQIDFAKNLVGKTVNVLFERKKDGAYEGYTSNYVKVSYTSSEKLENQILPVKVSQATGSKGMLTSI